MNASIIIARLLGPLLLASAIAILLNRKGIEKASESGAKNPALVYLGGVMSFLGGLAIVEFHNVWIASWQTMITVVGWLMLAGGAARMLVPERFAAMAKSAGARNAAIAISAAISGIIGFVLTLQGFAS